LVAEEWVDGWGVRNGWAEGEGGGMGGWKDGYKGVYMFSSLMKQNKKAKICFVICFAGKKKLLFYIYAVIVKQKIYKRSSNYY
jgi:hypothetical protein